MKIKIFTLLLLVFSINLQAQFFKKLKAKVSEKIEDTAIKKVTEIINPNKKVEKDIVEKNSSTNIATGTFSIQNNNTIGSVSIDDFGSFSNTTSPHTLKITGHWNTHGVDIADGIFITIIEPNFTDNHFDIFKNKSYTLYTSEDNINSTGAVVSIAYDPLKTKNTPSEKYQNYYLTSGQLTIESIQENEIKLHVKGQPVDQYNTIKTLPTFVDANLTVNHVTFIDNNSYTTESTNKKDSEYTTENINLEAYGIGKVETVNKQYNFNKEIVYEYISNDQKNQFHLLQNKDQPYYGVSIPTDEGSMVFIQDEEISISLIESNHQKMQMPSMNQGLDAQIKQQYHNLDTSNITKTGKTKNILNYQVDQYIVKDNQGGVLEIWATEQLDLNNVFLDFKNNIKGYVLETKYTHQKNTFSTKAIKIIEKNQSFKTSEYRNMMNMGY